MGKRFQLSLAILLAASLFLSACGGVDQAADGGEGKQVLNLMQTSEPPGLDSATTTDAVSNEILNNVMEGLYRLDKNNEPVEGMAEDVEISKDKKTYTFKLREAEWSDGEPVTAQDFEYAWKRALDPKTKSEYAYIMYPVKGAQKYNTGKGNPEDVGVKALDDKTLEVKLEEPIPYFQGLLTFTTFYPQREDILEEHGNKYATEVDKMVYNGPFVMSDWQHQKSYQLKKNDKYWDHESVKLVEINFSIVKETSTGVNLFETGKLDVATLSDDFVDKYADSESVVEVPESTTFYLQFNTDEKFFDNGKIRKAFSMVLDRSTITDKLRKDGSEPAAGLVPSVIQVEDQSFRELSGNHIKPKADPKEAKKLLKEGLKEVGLDKLPTVELIGYDHDQGKKEQEYMKEALESALDINVKIQILPFEQKLDRESNGDFQFSFAGWGADYNDPMTFMDLMVTDGPYNRGGWSNKEYDKLIEKSLSNPDFEERAKDLATAEKILMNEMGLVPIYHRSRLNLQDEKVKELYRHPFGADRTFKWTYIEE
ncbi:peptide ABC transporter substrate-binding protein [Desmospora profundinema]|uniref:Oligopeptide transport system substrate-binding protein n=1 Tax=Desmospora profundinema TaxID=1571184 RepID=A0ABU1INH0_9BACL|nr:peptide ABC transporter substrate-binding protein [Desmospora profundinema]MDR6226283.1 oligopeptide transport system substrate-binding protein [Desmospora profundinema]